LNLIRVMPAEGVSISKYLWLIPFLLLSSFSFAAAGNAKPELTVYAYDSWVAPGGAGAELLPYLQKECGCTVHFLASGDGGQVLSRAELELQRGKPRAQILLGLDQNLWARAQKVSEPWSEWKPRSYAQVPEELRVGDGFLPLDYGAFALMADTKAIPKEKLPHSLQDLLSPGLKRSLILEDPRTSTPGLGLVLFTREVLGEAGFQDFWKKLRPQWLTLAPGWDGAYGLFLKEEAPLVWSYTTSQAYHRAHGDSAGRYQAVLFDEGQPVQIEGAVLVKGALKDAAERASAHRFLEALLKPQAQALLAQKNWMLPVIPKVPLPQSFQSLPKPKRLVRTEKSLQASAVLKLWGEAIR
jgi:thiamine transport system substrate-binding protein